MRSPQAYVRRDEARGMVGALGDSQRLNRMLDRLAELAQLDQARRKPRPRVDGHEVRKPKPLVDHLGPKRGHVPPEMSCGATVLSGGVVYVPEVDVGGHQDAQIAFDLRRRQST